LFSYFSFELFVAPVIKLKSREVGRNEARLITASVLPLGRGLI